MASKQDIEAMKRISEEGFGKGDLSALDVLSDNFVSHNPPPTGEGKEAYKELVKLWRSSFPDLQMKVEKIVAGDDTVVSYVTTSGTHTGEAFLGIQPSGRGFKINEIHIGQFKEGKLAEHWGVVDLFSIMVQLGAINP